MKKQLLFFFIFLLFLFFLRNFLYRWIVNYQPIKARETVVLVDSETIKWIDEATVERTLDFYSIVDISNKLTMELLSFTFKKTTQNPNELIVTRKANCVGYSALFNTITNYLIQKNGLSETIISTHLVGKLKVGGIDLHQFVDSPFFANHDYSQIENRITGEIIWIDPSIGDYLKIERVQSEKLNN